MAVILLVLQYKKCPRINKKFIIQICIYSLYISAYIHSYILQLRVQYALADAGIDLLVATLIRLSAQTITIKETRAERDAQ